MTDRDEGNTKRKHNSQKEAKRQRHMACLSKTSTILNKLLQKCRKRLMKSKKLDGLKKQREILLSKLDQLGTALQTNDVDKFLKFPKFQAILAEIDEELPYIEKHIDRMESANAIKRAFIKKNVCKKFKEISERISNISRSINVFQVNESSEFSTVEQDIKDVQSQMDKLAGDIKENGSRRDLDQAIRQPPKAKKSKPAVPSEEHKSVDSIDELESPDTQGAKAEQLLQDGHCYFYGEGTQKNIEKAVNLYQKSAKLGSANACISLGSFYENNPSGHINSDMAAHFYRIAADLHNPYGLYKTGQYIEKGFHQYNNDEEARIEMFKAYKSAIEFGNVEATLRLAKIYEKGEHSVQLNKDKALELYEQICSNNQALNNIGTILYERAQYKRAADYFRKATAKGNLESMSNLAICYELGKGVYKDLDKAYELYQESAKKDNPQAMSNLGFLLYKKGKASQKPGLLFEAAIWLRRSISKDYTLKDSHFLLGTMHHNGEGVDQCYKSAIKFYKAAADLGHDIACERLGDLCNSGYAKTIPNMEKSLHWYTLGAKKGSNQCLNKMGLIIETGFDSYTPDPLRAAELYQKAYENHNSDGAYNLGLLYLNSEEFDATEEEAVQLIHQAAMQGNQKAQKYLLSLGYIDNSAEFIPQDSFIYPSYSEDIYEEEESEDEDDIVQYINFDHQSLDEEAVSEVQVQNNRTPTPNFPLMEKSQAGKIYQMTGQIMKNKDAIRPQPKGVSKVKFKAEKENSDMIQNPNATQKDVTSKTSPKKAPKTAPKTAPKAAPKAAPKIAPKATPKIVPKATPKPKISNAMTGAIVRNKPKGPEEKKGKIVKQKHKTFFI